MVKRLLLFLSLGWLFFHLAMTFIYLGPDNLLKLRLGQVAYGYMEMFFYQNWHLFSPDPGFTTTKFAVRCEDEGGHWTQWKDPFAGVLQQHQWLRVSGYGKVLMLFDDIAQSLKRDIMHNVKTCKKVQCETEEIDQGVMSESPKELATRFSIDYCRSKHPERPATLHAVQYKILDFTPMPFTKYSEHSGRWDKVLDLPFEPVTVAEIVGVTP